MTVNQDPSEELMHELATELSGMLERWLFRHKLDPRGVAAMFMSTAIRLAIRSGLEYEFVMEEAKSIWMEISLQDRIKKGTPSA